MYCLLSKLASLKIDSSILPLASKTLAIIFCITPSFLTRAGALIKIGNSNVSVATSMSMLPPTGTVLELHVVCVNKTYVILVQSM